MERLISVKKRRKKINKINDVGRLKARFFPESEGDYRGATSADRLKPRCFGI
jgi:hypothetical protein